MPRYVVLLRGINVGGKNKLSMKALKACLEELGYANVSTYINSGNVVLDSRKSASAIERRDRERAAEALQARQRADQGAGADARRSSRRWPVAGRRASARSRAEMYHSDAIFLMRGLKLKDAVGRVRSARGCGCILAGEGRHLSPAAERTADQEQAQQDAGDAALKSMTIRTGRRRASCSRCWTPSPASLSAARISFQ